MKLKELFYLNMSSLDSKTELNCYRYLDTGNITNNIINYIKEYNSKDELPSRARRLVKKGDIIISTVKPNQKHYDIILSLNKPLIVSTGFAVLTPKEREVNGLYLYYFLTKKETIDYLQMIAEGSVTAYPSIKPNVIGNIEVDFPDISIQNEVADKIKNFDFKILNNIELIDRLQEYAQLQFYKWFVDFNFRIDSRIGYKSNNGRMIEVDGENIPFGWKMIELNEIIDKETEIVSPFNNPDNIFKHYSIPAFDDIKSYKEEFGLQILSDKYIVSKKNILVSKLNPWFKRIVYPKEDAICSTEFVVWKPKIEGVKEYLYILANSPDFITYCTNASSGTSNSHKRVKPEFMMRYKIPFNEEVVLKFNEEIKPIVEKINLLMLENNKLNEMKDLLVKKLIN